MANDSAQIYVSSFNKIVFQNGKLNDISRQWLICVNISLKTSWTDSSGYSGRFDFTTILLGWRGIKWWRGRRTTKSSSAGKAGSCQGSWICRQCWECLHICMLYLIFFCIFESCLKIFKMQHSGCWWFVVVSNIRTFLHRSQMPFILWCMRCFDTEADYPSRCVQMTTQDLRVLQCLGDKSKVLLFWNRKLYTINQFLSGRPEQTVLDALDFATILRGWGRHGFRWRWRTTKSCAEASAG